MSGERDSTTKWWYLRKWAEKGKIRASIVNRADHRSLEAWQEARTVVLKTLELSRDRWKPYAAGLFSQLQRSSLSVKLNIAEGYAYAKSASFTHHLAIAYGSAVETGELLEIAVDAKLLPIDVVQPILTSNQRSQRLLLGLLKWRRRG